MKGYKIKSIGFNHFCGCDVAHWLDKDLDFCASEQTAIILGRRKAEKYVRIFNTESAKYPQFNKRISKVKI